MHEVLSGGRLKEVHTATGNDLGGLTVDKHFQSCLQEIFGNEVCKAYKNAHGDEWQKIMYNFAIAKCTEEDNGFEFVCSVSLNEVIKKHRGEDAEAVLQGNRDAKWRKGTIKISPEKFKSFFDESLRGIAEILKKIIRSKTLKIEYLLLVGGFASCKILQEYIKRHFGTQCQVLCPLYPQEAVKRGAVQYGMQQEVIKSRICAFTYGTNTCRLFDFSKHDIEKKFTTSDNVEWCRDLFTRLVKCGESVDFDEDRSYTYYPVAPDQTSMSLKFFSTTRENAEYVDEWGMKQIGSITISMPDTSRGLDREVRLDVKFGSTEITATATDLDSNNTKTAKIDFKRRNVCEASRSSRS